MCLISLRCDIGMMLTTSVSISLFCIDLLRIAHELRGFIMVPAHICPNPLVSFIPLSSSVLFLASVSCQRLSFNGNKCWIGVTPQAAESKIGILTTRNLTGIMLCQVR